MANFKSVFKNLFPFISAAASIGGPLGTLAANAVGGALGVNVDPTQDGIDQAITDAQIKDPEALSKLQQAEQNFQIQMKKMGLDSADKIYQIDAEDRANARAMHVAVKDKLPAIMAISVTIGFFGLLALLVFRDIPTGSATIINIMTGSLGTAWIGIVNFYFGSSAGSKASGTVLADIASKK